MKKNRIVWGEEKKKGKTKKKKSLLVLLSLSLPPYRSPWPLSLSPTLLPQRTHRLRERERERGKSGRAHRERQRVLVSSSVERTFFPIHHAASLFVVAALRGRGRGSALCCPPRGGAPRELQQQQQ